ncbi:MAG: ATP-binding cassette domain-containing protein [Ignavibacteria bacterium]|nr:ATP-binding cassette domain-containing protein [Ignavibacteria bacterium]
MTSFSLTGVRKSYNGRTVLRDIAVSGTSGDVVGILGANGSGKSTLMRIIAESCVLTLGTSLLR